MKKTLSMMLALTLTLSAATSFAKATETPKPKRQPASELKQTLGLAAGDYRVVTVRSSVPKENLCEKDLVHAIVYSENSDDLVLAVGEAESFSDFNMGLVTDSEPYYDDGCVYTRNTQIQRGLMTSDVAAKCNSKTESTRIELRPSSGGFNYSATKRSTKNGKTHTTSSSCALKKI